MLKIIIIIFLIILDFSTKQIVFNLINLNNFLYITSFLDLAHIHNFGISFGLFSGQFSPWFFTFIGFIVTGLVYIIFLQSKNNTEKWGLSVIIAGALGNILDRAINGYVLDFLYFHYSDFYWPAFNFADICISIGIMIIVLNSLKNMLKRNNK